MASFGTSWSHTPHADVSVEWCEGGSLRATELCFICRVVSSHRSSVECRWQEDKDLGNPPLLSHPTTQLTFYSLSLDYNFPCLPCLFYLFSLFCLRLGDGGVIMRATELRFICRDDFIVSRGGHAGRRGEAGREWRGEIFS